MTTYEVQRRRNISVSWMAAVGLIAGSLFMNVFANNDPKVQASKEQSQKSFAMRNPMPFG